MENITNSSGQDPLTVNAFTNVCTKDTQVRNTCCWLIISQKPVLRTCGNEPIKQKQFTSL